MAEVSKIKQKKVPSTSLTIKIDDLLIFDPLTKTQQIFYNEYKKGTECIALTGSAGTGKTHLALYKALEEVLDKSNQYQKVVIIRSAVQVRDQGFVSGDLEEKSAIFETPYIGLATKMFNRSDAYQRLKEQKHLEFQTTTAIRGITLDNSIIIVDEATNLSWAELSAVFTRIGVNSKFIICGDLTQNDLNKSKNDVSGFSIFLDVVSGIKNFIEIKFTSDDIVRSELVKKFIMACEKKNIALY